MKRTLWKLFPFTAIDSKAAEAWLNRLGEQGWRLGSAGLYTARFWQTGEPVSYAVTPEQGRREDFLVLCRDAGWELTARSRKMELYASRRGRARSPWRPTRRWSAAASSAGESAGWPWRRL